MNGRTDAAPEVAQSEDGTSTMTAIAARPASAPSPGLTMGDVGHGLATAGLTAVAGVATGAIAGSQIGRSQPGGPALGLIVGGAAGLIIGGVSGLVAGGTVAGMRDGSRDLALPGGIAGAVTGATLGGVMGVGWQGKLAYGAAGAVAGALAGALGGTFAS